MDLHGYETVPQSVTQFDCGESSHLVVESSRRSSLRESAPLNGCFAVGRWVTTHTFGGTPLAEDLEDGGPGR